MKKQNILFIHTTNVFILYTSVCINLRGIVDQVVVPFEF